jgi:uncharacterized membrane protein
MIGQFSVVGWAMAVGLAITLPVTVVRGIPDELDAVRLGWLLVSGVAVVGGLLLAYAALRVGKVAVVAPIMATEGAVAATIAAIAGAPLDTVTGLLLVGIVVGVVLSMLTPEQAPVENEQPVKAVILAGAGAVLFGSALFLTGTLSGQLPIEWVLLAPRLVGTMAILGPLALTRRLRLTRTAAPLVVVTGISEVLGYWTLGVGARESLPVVVVLSSQFATLGAVLAWILFGERPGRLQMLGGGIVVTCVAVLALASTT